MKLASIQNPNGEPALALLVGNLVVETAGSWEKIGKGKPAPGLATMRTFLGGGDEAFAQVTAIARAAVEDPEQVKVVDVPLTAPIPFPSKLLCLAGNYPAHIREGGGQVPDKSSATPRMFIKPCSTITDPGQPIRIPRLAGHIDWEGELAVVIGRTAKYVDAADALKVVAGYTIVNDVSERRLNLGAGKTPREGDRWFHWLNGKWMDTFAPMGPCLVTADDVPDPQNLPLEVRVNGEVKQSGNTSEMIFSCAEAIAWASRLMTLQPGDIICTGTPAGVGSATGQSLQPGDEVQVRIDPIGVLTNPVEAEPGISAEDGV